MKAAYKASLLSAFVFPGAGQLYLKKYWRGLVIMIVFLSGAIFIVWSNIAPAFNRLDSIMVKMQSGAASLQQLAEISESPASTKSFYYDAVFYSIVCIWILAIVDAYRLGRKKDFPESKSPG
ncbi:MAG: hypothetical protein CVU54_05570 [Deltaproteobacteria bacterium HGW-Deltaproteobacteria-12]|jgi:TM2 domain-containing membrane protein YozV|nr:MAG: hypothetical protein CVU54_05570 [Deltaproteobacteria bacterium HGW-Deltaproteobacteria-12]